jgi:hypothetical protein
MLFFALVGVVTNKPPCIRMNANYIAYIKFTFLTISK